MPILDSSPNLTQIWQKHTIVNSNIFTKWRIRSFSDPMSSFLTHQPQISSFSDLENVVQHQLGTTQYPETYFFSSDPYLKRSVMWLWAKRLQGNQGVE